MRNNTYFQAMHQTATEYEQARTAHEVAKKSIQQSGDQAAMDAWYERKAAFKSSFPLGQRNAYTAWFNTAANESSTFEVDDLPWPKDIHDFVETLRAAGITEFAVTDHSSGLMEGLHGLATEGCTIQGLCKVTRSEARWGGEGTTEYDGILFHT